jgi:hypothetical protein
MLIIKSFSATIERPGLESLPDGNKEAKGGQDHCRGYKKAKVVAEGHKKANAVAEGHKQSLVVTED